MMRAQRSDGHRHFQLLKQPLGWLVAIRIAAGAVAGACDSAAGLATLAAATTTITNLCK